MCIRDSFGTLYEGYEAEPANMAWVSQYSNANLVKTDFFEAKSTAYAKSTADVYKRQRENRACSIHARFFYAAGQPCGTRRNSFLIWF